LVAVLIMGWSGAATIGAGAATGMKRLDFVRVTPSYVTPGAGAITNYAMDNTGVARDVVVDVLHGASQGYGIRSTLPVPKIEGIRFTDDDVSSGQIFFSGSLGYKNLYFVEWAGGTKKVSGAASPTGSVRDWRRLDLTIWDDNAGTHPAAGIPCRITDAVSQVQLGNGLFNVNGTYSLLNSLAGAPTVGEINKNIVAASEWTVDGVETVLDTYLKIEVNPANMAGYNNAYRAITVTARLTRGLQYDPATAAYVVADFQPSSSHIHIALPLIGSPPSIDGLAVVADGVDRIYMQLPSAA